MVVGCGIAGLSAAVTAQQNGARVAILERAPKDERGGNTRYTESLWRMKTVDAVSEDFLDKFAANAGGWPDPGIVQDAVLDRDCQPRVLRSLGVVDPQVVADPPHTWACTCDRRFLRYFRHARLLGR